MKWICRLRALSFALKQSKWELAYYFKLFPYSVRVCLDAIKQYVCVSTCRACTVHDGFIFSRAYVMRRCIIYAATEAKQNNLMVIISLDGFFTLTHIHTASQCTCKFVEGNGNDKTKMINIILVWYFSCVFLCCLFFFCLSLSLISWLTLVNSPFVLCFFHSLGSR